MFRFNENTDEDRDLLVATGFEVDTGGRKATCTGILRPGEERDGRDAERHFCIISLYNPFVLNGRRSTLGIIIYSCTVSPS